MAYREKVFNANVLTDLLSTYLTHNAQEREKYYDAEIKASKPQYKTVDGNLVEISRGGEIKTLMSKQKEEKEPKFEDFTKDGIIYKGQFMGKDYTQTPEDIEVGMPKSYQYTGFSDIRFKPEDADKNKEGLIKETRDFSTKRVAQLRRIKEGRINANDAALIQTGFLPPKWDEETLGPELIYYQNVLRDTEKYLPEGLTGIPVYDPKLQNNTESSEKENFWETNVSK